VVVENMQMQYQQFVAEREGRERGEEAKMVEGVAVIAVAPGGGLKNLFTDELGAARVVTGGQTMNPSTGEFLNCIASLPNTEIVILPNNKNIFLAAKQAAEATKDRQVRVIPSRTVPQGISAMVEYNILRESGEVSLDEMAEGMQEALRNVISAEITTATRTVEIGGVSVSEGQLIGLLEGELVIAGEDMEQVMRDLLYKAKADKREIITLYYGNNTHRAKAQALVDVLSPEFSKQEFQVVFGGQALYPYIISIE
jgi:dihydroxyacetone kinase-like predicted kinase